MPCRQPDAMPAFRNTLTDMKSAVKYKFMQISLFHKPLFRLLFKRYLNYIALIGKDSGRKYFLRFLQEDRSIGKT